MTRPRLAFLCRGSSDVGLGHVMRCRTVAEAARRQSDVLLCVVGDASVEPLVMGRSVRCEVLAREERAVAVVSAFEPDAVVLDTTRLARRLFNHLAVNAMTVSLSPVFDQLERCDLFFHRTAYHPMAHRAGWYCGLPYAVIRPECTPITSARYDEVVSAAGPLSVAISMGGGDASNKALRVLERLRTVASPLLLWVLLGEGYGHSYDALAECAQRDRRHEVILARTTASMWRVMSSCAVAVLAGGTVTYESVAAGIPSINVFDDPAQTYLVRELVEHGSAIDAGGPFAIGLDNAAEQVEALANDRSVLRAMHAATRRLIDGQGASRIVDAICSRLARVVEHAA